MEFTIDEKAVVKMNKPKISTCLLIWKHVLIACLNYPINLQQLSFTLKAQALQRYSKSCKLILLWESFEANIRASLWELYPDLQNIKNDWMVLPYTYTLYTKVVILKTGEEGTLSFLRHPIWVVEQRKLLLPFKLNSCLKHQRVYEKSMQERGNLRKP